MSYYIESLSDVPKIQSIIQEYGFVIIKNVVSSWEHQEFINDIYNYIDKTPRKPEKKIELSRDEIEQPLSRDKVKELRERWYLHATFGAPTEFHAFQLPTANKLREKPEFYQLYSSLLGEEKLLYYQDRFCLKLPGAGETEFIHIDADPHYRKPMNEAPLQSIVFFSDTKFHCIPKSHTQEFHQQITDNYTYITKNKKPRNMTMIDKKNDVLNLESKLEAIDIPKDSILIFTENLWHASKPNRSDKFRLALYFGYHRYNQCPNTIAERLESYQTGRRPIRFPSGAKTYLAPKMYYNFPDSPHLMKKYLALIPENYIGTHTIKKNNREVSWLNEQTWNPIETHDYVPYQHSSLGRKLLGIEDWS